MQTSKSFRAYDLGQTLLLPPDMNDWLPEGHLARFVAETISTLDLSAFFASYSDGRGLSAYHPQMMLSVLVYGYCTGTRSSRKLATACQENVAFRFLSGNSFPSHNSIASFRRRHLAAMEDFFAQVFELCCEAGLVQLGHVAIDGSKFKADASKHKAVSWGRLDERRAHYEGVAKDLLRQAEAVDAAEDDEHGEDNDGSGLPNDLKRTKGRLAKLKEAKKALEDRARKKAEEEREHVEHRLEDIARREAENGQKHRGRKPTPPDPAAATPVDKDQYNFTDPDARIMRNGATKGFEYAYNAQIGVDGESGIILGTHLTDHPNDKRELIPTIEAIRTNTNGMSPEKVSADNGYYSENTLKDSRVRDIDLYIPPSKKRSKKAGNEQAEGGGDHLPPDDDHSLAATMRRKLQTTKGKDVYRMRKAIAESPFGIIKSVMGFRAFSMRGKDKVAGEWSLVTGCFNLRKLIKTKQAAMTA